MTADTWFPILLLVTIALGWLYLAVTGHAEKIRRRAVQKRLLHINDDWASRTAKVAYRAESKTGFGDQVYPDREVDPYDPQAIHRWSSAQLAVVHDGERVIPAGWVDATHDPSYGGEQGEEVTRSEILP